ncbi:tetratricopeptide repeat protein [Parasphaerochaeta coccoides]|uniref:Uncharacterized protein n=1 Tax=Parasphaerochaeta coccoides (strain ATCC BAA-1237 / DSM 17374 / SPN1) TaxID=760011 RepID=F4GH54_PARC1|nr:hypothetical protein [Parasphaerochaeta coccoides]AEC01529.1 hypothetical protein Spico_0299 [Parasphaerochaeta coccoides DSM 17374]
MKHKSLMIAFAVAAAITITLPATVLPGLGKLGILALLLFLFLYAQRATLFFVQGNRELSRPMPDMEKVWHSYARACKAGLPAKRLIDIANAHIQRGDVDEGRMLLDSPAVKALEDEKDRARIQLIQSMADFRDGNLKGAVARLVGLREKGIRDKTLYINLSTYLLAAGEMSQADELLAEAQDEDISSAGLDDNRGWSAIIKGDWDAAATIYDALFKDSSPGFPEAFLHAAQVRFHYALVEDGLILLGEALEKRFSCVTGAAVPVIQDIIDTLSDEGKMNATLAVLEDKRAVVAAGGSPW